MTSVGIMSMQRIFNYGSSLQAFALRRLLEEIAPRAGVSFVDYRPGPPLVALSPPESAARSQLGRIVSKVREYNNVQTTGKNKVRFFNHKRTYARKYFPLIGIPEEPDWNLDLDLQVIGSDEVFNCVQSNPNVGYARDLFGHESPARQIISYAGSFGNTTLEKIEGAGIREEVADDLRRFAAISVRDQNSAEVVHALVGERPQIHLDPTLVYDFSGSTPIVPAARQYPGTYVIVYGYSGRFGPSENASIRRYAEGIGARVLSFGGLQSSADEFIDCDPFTLLAYFRDASAVITDTFHGTIFSIINEVPFVTTVRKSAGHAYGNEEKLSYLLRVLGLGDRALRDGESLATLLSQPIDWASVQRIRGEEQKRTRDFLSRAIESA